MKKILLFLSLSLLLIQAKAQTDSLLISPEGLETLTTYEDTLGLLGFAIVNDSLEQNRFGAIRKFIPTLVKALKVKNSFHHPFERLRSISITYPPDSTFRIFTWQLFVSNDEYRYFGAIQMNTEELKLIPLSDRSVEITAPEIETLSSDRWYGSLYYKIQPFDTPTGTQYLVFGLDYYDFHTRRKIIDVLHFSPSGDVVFGAPVFVSESEPGRFNNRKRVVLEYTAQTSITSNYDEQMSMVIFDHLKSINLPSGPAMIPDGSYEGFQLADGQWNHIEKIFDQVSEEPPRPFPVLDGPKKDIFGQK